jgi:hypothetical protein
MQALVSLVDPETVATAGTCRQAIGCRAAPTFVEEQHCDGALLVLVPCGRFVSDHEHPRVRDDASVGTGVRAPGGADLGQLAARTL